MTSSLKFIAAGHKMRRFLLSLTKGYYFDNFRVITLLNAMFRILVNILSSVLVHIFGDRVVESQIYPEKI